MEPRIIDGTAEDFDDMPAEPEHPAAGSDLATRQSTGKLVVAPEAEAADLVARLDVIRDAMDNAMTRDVDYGLIPGAQKPSLYKPGAEKLGVLFQLDVEIDNEKAFGPGDHLTVSSKATVYHVPTGKRLASGEGLCTSRERKYGKRQAQRICPACGVAAIIKGKEEYGGGWVCFKKQGGCGAKYPDQAPEIVGQAVGEIDNPDIPDQWNTIVKMAAKRARIDAILAATGASALFTQDVEDHASDAPASSEPGAAMPHGPAADHDLLTVARPALKTLCRGDADAARDRWDTIRSELGVDRMPVAAATALVHAARALEAAGDDLPWVPGYQPPIPEGELSVADVDPDELERQERMAEEVFSGEQQQTVLSEATANAEAEAKVAAARRRGSRQAQADAEKGDA